MTPLDLLRAARDLESAGLDAEADRLRWRVACAVSGSVAPAQSAPGPAASGEEDPAPGALSVLGPALRDAEACGDLATVAVLVGALAGLERPSRSAA